LEKAVNGMNAIYPCREKTQCLVFGVSIFREKKRYWHECDLSMSGKEAMPKLFAWTNHYRAVGVYVSRM
jgi:hypothetical protein